MKCEKYLLAKAHTGAGKTPMGLAWAENVRRYTGRPVLFITPLAVAQQTAREAEKFGGVVCDESSVLKNFSGVRRGEITRSLRRLGRRRTISRS